MESRPRSERASNISANAFRVAFAATLVAWSGISAYAREAETEVAASVPCAIVIEVAGEVDVLDTSRTHLLDSSKHASVPCGGWVSVGKGSAELKHRDGFKIHVGAGTFVRMTEPNTDGKNAGEQAILYRGQIFAQAGGGSGEIRVVTANARARVRRGSAVVVYNHEDEETQVIALDGQSSLENRFESSRWVKVNAGEATSLNFKQLRVVPSTARAVALAALRPKFEDLRVPDRDRMAALHSAQSRQERIFATALVETGDAAENEHLPKAESHAEAGHQPKRSIASVDHSENSAKSASAEDSAGSAQSEDPAVEVREHLKKAVHINPPAESYASHVEDEHSRAAHKKWLNRMVAGQEGAGSIINPEVAPKKKPSAPGGAQIEVVDLGASHRKARKLTAEDEEKLKLIDELSRIHED